MIRVLICLVLFLFIAGCAEIEPPTPDQVIKHPLGTDPLRIGMTKEEVIFMWGEPDVINKTGLSKGLGGTKREEWVYYPRYSDVPLDKGYLSKARHLYFDGNNLVRFNK